jgi:hypothetical protein
LKPGQQQHRRSGARRRIDLDGVSATPDFGAAQQVVTVVFGKLLGGVWMHVSPHTTSFQNWLWWERANSEILALKMVR